MLIVCMATAPPPLPLLSADCCSDLAGNGLSGSLPREWGALASLKHLDASGNYLSGALPDGWGEMGSLQELQLANNNLGVRIYGSEWVQRGEVGQGRWMRFCSAVEWEDDSAATLLPYPFRWRVALQGCIPASWARLPLLSLLNLASNVGVCGGQPRWGAATQVRANATNLGQSCFMVRTSGALAGAVLGECGCGSGLSRPEPPPNSVAHCLCLKLTGDGGTCLQVWL